MYCPKCGVRNVEDAKYCRSCGADIGLVPQALSGTLPEGASGAFALESGASKGRKGRKKAKEPPTREKGLETVFTGIALMVIFLLGFFYFTAGFLIWVWFIIPGLASIGQGIGQIIRATREPRALTHAPFGMDELAPHGPAHRGELQPRETSEINPQPLSVTEGTTRHLDAAGTAKN